MNNQPRKRPNVTSGKTYKIVTGCGNLYVTVNRDNDGLCEVFAHLGKSGQCGAAQIEAICRSVSIGLRSGVSPDTYIDQLDGIRCPSSAITNDVEILSCADGIAQALQLEKEKQ